jgi:NADH-quinone oxidoreductase subunit L
MFDLFSEQPGLLFVAATLLPLASFVIQLVLGGFRNYLRSLRKPDSDAPPTGDALGLTSAYIATGAMFIAFLLSLTGFIWLNVAHAEHAAHSKAAHARHGHSHGEGEKADHEHGDEAKHEETENGLPWAGSIEWAHVAPKGLAYPGVGTVLRLGYYIDSLAALMFVMVTLIATLIHLYSIGYMGEELNPTVEDHQVHAEHGHFRRRGRFGRFFLFMSLFCFSMLNLVLADNLFQVFVSWELVGICSYLLIGFYYERQSASNAANKAFITNRVGDAGFVIGLMIVWTFIGTFNFQDIFKQVRAPDTDSHGDAITGSGQIIRAVRDEQNANMLTVTPFGSEVVLFPLPAPGHFHPASAPGAPVNLDPAWQNAKRPDGKSFDRPQYRSMPYWLLVVAGLGIFLGCVGKSAQFPLQVWLPDAMEGPTPVSALIHAATMVAAGVYLVGRCFPLFTYEVLLTIAYTGAVTMFVAATVAVVMTDIKKVLAYSTVSQLGYMMLALGIGGWVSGLFHLLTHAFFKALLFLGSGSVIYGCHHEQDMEKMGGLYPKMKVTAITMLFGVLAIAGTPFFCGWYSKDAIVADSLGFAVVHGRHFLLFLFPLLTAGITSFYMFRMWFMTFTGKPRDHHVHEHAHESPMLMTLPLVVLAFFSLAVAWGWPVWDPQNSWLESEIHHSQPTAVLADFGHLAEIDGAWLGQPARHVETTERYFAHQNHSFAGFLALGAAALGFVFAYVLYYVRLLNPAEAKAQFPAVHRFLTHKWYFDELYSALLVRPAVRVAGWCRAFDTYVIDGFIDNLGRCTVLASKWDGMFDAAVVDGLVNLTARVCQRVGTSLRTLQTGYLRSYVLFLVIAAVGIWIVLSYLVGLAAAQ